MLLCSCRLLLPTFSLAIQPEKISHAVIFALFSHSQRFGTYVSQDPASRVFLSHVTRQSLACGTQLSCGDWRLYLIWRSSPTPLLRGASLSRPTYNGAAMGNLGYGGFLAFMMALLEVPGVHVVQWLGVLRSWSMSKP